MRLFMYSLGACRAKVHIQENWEVWPWRTLVFSKPYDLYANICVCTYHSHCRLAEGRLVALQILKIRSYLYFILSVEFRMNSETQQQSIRKHETLFVNTTM